MLRALQNQRRKSADAGFTLIELLIVIIILGILAAIVVFSVRGITDNGNEAACKASVSTIDTAFEAAYANSDAKATVGALVPKYLHSAPVIKLKGSDVTTSGMSNAAVDAIDCTS